MSGRQYQVLEAYRGVAALTVVTHHFLQVSTPGPWPQPKGHLAVDLFFLISGFVLQDAFGRKLKEGLTPAQLLRLRFERLAPLLFLGALIGCSRPIADILLHLEHRPTISQFFSWAATNGLMLPAPHTDILFPLNLPVWSTFFQILGTILFAVGLSAARTSVLVAAMALGAAGIVHCAWSNATLNLGWAWSHVEYGFARLAFSFPLGILMARCKHRLPQHGRVGLFAPVALLMAVFLVPVASAYAGAYDVFAILVLNPVLLVVALAWRAPERWQPACTLLGRLSFPLYALHYPLLLLDMAILRRMPHELFLNYAIFMTVCIAVAAWAYKHYDPLVRRWLVTVGRRVPRLGNKFGPAERGSLAG
jgi:peptidoglycan/LPS O-acetylase OafA/YrhL